MVRLKDSIAGVDEKFAPAERIGPYCNDHWLARCRRLLTERTESSEKKFTGRFFGYLQVFRTATAVFIELVTTLFHDDRWVDSDWEERAPKDAWWFELLLVLPWKSLILLLTLLAAAALYSLIEHWFIAFD